jgi:peptide/nickel transport system ATP-binding protein
MTTPHHPYTIMLLCAVLSVAKPMRSMAASTADPVQAVPVGGCPFRQRCAIAIAQRCADQIPPVQQLTNGHQVRCHHPPAVLHAYRQEILHLDM